MAADDVIAGTKPLRSTGVYNQWDCLKEAVVGIPDDTVEMDYIPAMKWLPDWEVAEPGKNRECEKMNPLMTLILQKQFYGYAFYVGKKISIQ